VTGLIWEVKTDSGTRSKNKKYKWGGLTAIGKAHGSREYRYYEDWNELVNYANDTDNANDTGDALCGFSDWRVPNMDDLGSIVYLGKAEAPLIDQNYFPNTQSSHYWSSSPSAIKIDHAWILRFNYVRGNDDYRSKEHYVRLVRGGR
jgi:hypothetical protein